VDILSRKLRGLRGWFGPALGQRPFVVGVHRSIWTLFSGGQFRGTIFCREVGKGCRGSGEAEEPALILPAERNVTAAKQLTRGELDGLAAAQDRRDDVWR
jgi:hypothetical protein